MDKLLLVLAVMTEGLRIAQLAGDLVYRMRAGQHYTDTEIDVLLARADAATAAWKAASEKAE